MSKYFGDSFWMKEIGEEECKKRDVYLEDLVKREDKLYASAMEKIEDLFQLINEKTNLNLTWKSELREYRNGNKCIEIESSEIENPVIALAWKSFKIGNFGGNIWSRKNKASHYGYEEDFSKPCAEVGYSRSIDFQYVHNDGGSNGAHIGSASFTESKGEWEFELVEKR